MRTAKAIGILICGGMLAGLLLSPSANAADAPNPKALEQAYPTEIRPLVERYCHECHSAKLAEAEVDLSAFATWGNIRKQPQVWQKVGEMLESGQMPPKDARQPTAAERARLQQWVRSYLTFEAQARAGDPGRVVLRRLSNAEYTFTLRDLTGIETLDPAREFPVDGAAGEGFTNTGSALVMSPALVTKYLDAAKEVASHAVLLPDGFRFSPSTTPRDWTNETLAEIRALYREFSDARGGDKVNLQGIMLDTNQGGRLPLDKYFAATLVERDALTTGRKTIDAVAKEHGLNAKYLRTLWATLTSTQPSLLLDSLRARWRTAKPADAAALAADVAAWQKGLWKFTTVGHIGKVGGPKAWLEPVSPITAKQEVRFKIPPTADGADVTLSLVASDLGDGNEHDFAVWQQPRLVAPGRPDILLRDVRAVAKDLAARRAKLFASTSRYLNAASEAAATTSGTDVAKLADKYGVEVAELRAWLDYLGIGDGATVEVTGHFTTKLNSASNYDFIKGWGSHQTPMLLANSSDQHVRIPGNMKPHGVAVHPSPTLRTTVGWRSPITGKMRVEGAVIHAHPECGNGVSWSLDLRRGATRQRLATGTAQGKKNTTFDPLDNLDIKTGDLLSLSIGPRDGNHSCDLTAIDLKITNTADSAHTWNLADDVSSDILAGNPHADRLGNAAVWHFYTEPEKGGSETGPVIPADSLLAKWLASKNVDEKQKLADDVQKLLTAGPPTTKDSPDAALYQQLASLGGPLLSGALVKRADEKANPPTPQNSSPNASAGDATQWGLDPALFGKHPDGSVRAAASLCVEAAPIGDRIPLSLPSSRRVEFIMLPRSV